MEILSNIWTALITENEFLTIMLTLPLMFVEISLSLYIFSFFLKISLPIKKKIIYILSVSIFSIISDIFIPQPYSVFLNYTFIFIILFKYFKFNIVQTIASIITPLAIFGLMNSLIMNPFLKICKITFEMASSIPIYRLLYLILTYLVIFTFLFLIKKVNMNNISIVNMDKRTKSIILVNLILGILTLIVQAILNFYYINSIPIIFTLFNFSLLFAYFFISFYSLTKAMKLDIATRDLENAESYNNSLTVLYDNVRGFKHDFDNMINIIGGYLQVDDITGLKDYFYSLETDYGKMKNVQMLNPNVINNPGIYNLIVSKYKKATDLDITINFEFFFDFASLHMPIYEFSRILGILLDNAIEASKECKDKHVNLVFRESRKQKVQIVIIENTYLNKEIDTKKIFEKGISGKENHSGIGLWEVNQIILKNNNIVLKTTNDEKYFRQELQIYF